MVLVGAVQIVLGWVWHIAYRARRHWSLKREGALCAAAFVAVLGVVDVARSPKVEPPASRTASAPAHTALATPVVTEAAKPIEILPATPLVETTPALPSPDIERTAETDPIGAKILERLGDTIATGSIVAKPKHKVRMAVPNSPDRSRRVNTQN
jgi:hypothetical protein